jgi:hypothetical protein
LGTRKEKCISKERTGKEFYSQKWGPEKNCDLKIGTGKELLSSKQGTGKIFPNMSSF